MQNTALRCIPETAYLNCENTDRYRAILHYFYTQHERLRHFLYPEEILSHMLDIPEISDYDEEKLTQDLKYLEEKKNLIPRQDPTRVTTIRDFRNKKFRYQATPYTIEIERMVERLTNLGNTLGGSLEITLFDRLLEHLDKLVAHENINGRISYPALQLPNDQLNQLWDDLYGYFRKMGESASDYLAHLKDDKVEEQMKTERFLAYKEAFTEYLRNFIVNLQQAATRIESTLDATPPDFVDQLTNRLADYQMSIPRIQEVEPDRAEFVRFYKDRWLALYEWFHGSAGHSSEWRALQAETNETIRRIARFAQRLGERLYHAHSRRRDYEHLAQWFAQMDDLDDAHRLSAAVFGVPKARHLQVDESQDDDMDQTLWDRSPTHRRLEPKVRTYRSRTRAQAAAIRTEEKAAARELYMAQRRAEQQLIQTILDRGYFNLADLGEVDPFVRKTLLGWINRCYQQQARITRTESGVHLKLETLDGDPILLVSPDGEMEMPPVAFKVVTR